MGSQPDWYRLIKSARYLGVAPWELNEQPLVWQHWAVAAQEAEAAAREQLDKMSKMGLGG